MNLIEKVKALVLGQRELRFQNGDRLEMANLEIIKTRSEILKELNSSKALGKLIGVYASSIGEGMFLTGVEDVYKGEKEVIVVLKPYDVGGNILQRNYLSLSEIKGVCPFNYLYSHPFIEKIRSNNNIKVT